MLKLSNGMKLRHSPLPGGEECNCYCQGEVHAMLTWFNASAGEQLPIEACIAQMEAILPIKIHDWEPAPEAPKPTEAKYGIGNNGISGYYIPEGEPVLLFIEAL